jgi:hypothetical protein|tara:strand:- start:4133 stop:4807 length:675 start_codon:yes stop_codon:yes gene_type:complete
MIDIKTFFEEYEEYVHNWVRIQNSFWRFHIDEDEYMSTLIEKFYKEETLTKYDPQKGKFQSWLSYVLRNHYVVLYRNIRRHEYISLEATREGDSRDTGGITENYLSSIVKRVDVEPILDQDLIDKLVNGIQNIGHRIVTKLKLYREDSTVFTDEEMKFMSDKSSKSFDEINQYITTNKKPVLGLRDKHIAEISGYSKGSINTTYQRIVRKHIIEAYDIERFKND